MSRLQHKITHCSGGWQDLAKFSTQHPWQLQCHHPTPQRKIGGEGNPQGVIAHRGSKHLVKQKEEGGSISHPHEHAPRGSGADVQAIKEKGGDTHHR